MKQIERLANGSYVVQGDGGWDLLAALDYLRGQADQSQEQHSLTAVEFLERRLRKVSIYIVSDTQRKEHRTKPQSLHMLK